MLSRVKITLFQGPDPSGRPRYADPPPLIRHWQGLYESTSGINEYSSSKLLVSGSPNYDAITGMNEKLNK